MPTKLMTALTFAENESGHKANPFAQAKDMLTSNLKEQLKAAQAMVKGETYMVSHTITVEENGAQVRKQIQKPKRVWYWRDNSGNIRFAIRIFNKLVEPEKGKTDIIVDEDKALPNIVSTTLKAVEAGELDSIITKLVNERQKSKK